MEKRVRVIKRFRDLKHGNILRKVDAILTVDEERAKLLVERGFVVLIEEIQEIETAVKEVKKEKAVKEKTIKKVTKKNAKK